MNRFGDSGSCSGAAASVGAIILIAAMATSAGAKTVKGTASLIPDDGGAPVSSEVTFELPHHAWIAGTLWLNPAPWLTGQHTCLISADETQDPLNGNLIEPGRVLVYARLQQSRKPGSVFVAAVTRRPDLSLLNAGCDGIPGNGDKFEAHAAALYAAAPVFLAQAMDSVEFHPDGKSVREELYDAFQINPKLSVVTTKLSEFHSFGAPFNPGGSAAGLASAQIILSFRSGPTN